MNDFYSICDSNLPSKLSRKSNLQLEPFIERYNHFLLSFHLHRTEKKDSWQCFENNCRLCSLKWKRMTQRKQKLLRFKQPLSSYRDTHFIPGIISFIIFVNSFQYRQRRRRHYTPYVCALKDDRSICDDDYFCR